MTSMFYCRFKPPTPRNPNPIVAQPYFLKIYQSFFFHRFLVTLLCFGLNNFHFFNKSIFTLKYPIVLSIIFTRNIATYFVSVSNQKHLPLSDEQLDYTSYTTNILKCYSIQIKFSTNIQPNDKPNSWLI